MTPGPTSPASDRERLFVSQLPEIDQVIGWICVRHHLRGADADDFASQVKLKLIEDDYAVLRKFQGRSTMRTYLSVVVQRLYLDFRVTSWGKWRPSAEARRGGPVAILIEQLHVRDGHTLDETYEIVTTNHRVPVTRSDFDSLVARLPCRPSRRMEPADVLESRPSALPPADAGVERQERHTQAARVFAALRVAIARFDVQDRLILRLRFEDGCTVPQIASVLRLDQKMLYRRLERLIRTLRLNLEADGVERAVVGELLADLPVGADSGEPTGASVYER